MPLISINILDISDDTALILFIVIQLIYTFILFPSTIFYTNRLWRLHKENVLFITKRRPQTVLFCIIVLNIYTVIIRLLTDLPRIWFKVTQFDNFYVRMFLVDFIHLFIYGLFGRIWLLFYDYQRNASLMSIEWKKRIMKQQNYLPWTLKYNFLGNTKIIVISTVILWIIAMFIIQFGCYIMGKYYANQLQLVTFIAPILGAVIIAFKIRKWNDLIYLKKELQLMAFVGFLSFTIFMCIVYPFLDLFWNIRLLITNIIICSYCYSLAFISTQWVIKKYNTQCIETPSDTQLSLEDILSDSAGFTLFANFLAKQFTLEHLLFLFEIMKLKNELIATEIISEKEAGILITMNYNNKSYKTLQSKNINEIADDFGYIIDEYIDLESEQSINISARIRKNVLKLKSLDDEISHKVSDISMDEIGIGSNDNQIRIHLNEITSNRMNSYLKGIDQIHQNEPDKIETMNTNSSNEYNEFDIILYIKKFDGVIEEVIKLLACDSLNKFYDTDQYQQMIKNQRFIN